jgi:hypothetical protein
MTGHSILLALACLIGILAAGMVAAFLDGRSRRLRVPRPARVGMGRLRTAMLEEELAERAEDEAIQRELIQGFARLGTPREIQLASVSMLSLSVWIEENLPHWIESGIGIWQNAGQMLWSSLGRDGSVSGITAFIGPADECEMGVAPNTWGDHFEEVRILPSQTLESACKTILEAVHKVARRQKTRPVRA